MGKYYETTNIDKIVEEMNEVGGLVLDEKLIKRDGFCTTSNILSYKDMPLITKYRLYIAYLKDAEESPLSYLDVEQYYIYWEFMKPEYYCDGNIYKIRQLYDTLMFFLKPRLDDSVQEAYEDSAIAIAERKAGVCGDEFDEEYVLDCAERARDINESMQSWL